jgi:hypothetical protein
MQTEATASRVAINESRFREANEAIEERAKELFSPGDRLPFLCECPLPDCRQIATLTLEEYETVRTAGNRFLVVPLHEIQVFEGEPIARVAERYDRFTIMEKFGRAGELAIELDPRADT